MNSKSSNPVGWSVKGNMIPGEVSNPQNVTPFTVNNCTLSLEGGIVIDGLLLIPVKSTPSF